MAPFGPNLDRMDVSELFVTARRAGDGISQLGPTGTLGFWSQA